MEKPTFQHPQPQSDQPIVGQVYSPNPTNDELIQMVQSLTNRIEMLENKRINFNTDLIGLIQTVTVAPTVTNPINPYQQVVISVVSGTTKLNVFDSLNKVWKSVTLT